MNTEDRLIYLKKMIDQYNYDVAIKGEEPFPREEFESYLIELAKLEEENPVVITQTGDAFFMKVGIPLILFMAFAIAYNIPVLTLLMKDMVFDLIASMTDLSNVSNGMFTFLEYATLLILPIIFLLITVQMKLLVKGEEKNILLRNLIIFDLVMVVVNILVFMVISG